MNSTVEKIRKVLAVAKSNNPNEAMTALLKARELMARYKLSDKDVENSSEQNQLALKVYTKDHFTDNNNGWFVRLGQAIAENHCCTVVVRPVANRKVMYISFAGLNEDPSIAMEVFAYAVQHIKKYSKQYKKEISHIVYEDDLGNRFSLEPKTVIKKTKNWESSYVTGFIRGLTYQYEIQFKSEGGENLALALTPDPKVQDLKNHMDQNADRVIKEETSDREAMIRGYQDGCNFDITRRKPVANLNATYSQTDI